MINNFRFENIQALYFSGDIHGEFKNIVYKLDQLTNTVLIVCGDIGMGFYKEEFYLTLFQKLNLKLSKKNNYLLMFRGNHDNPDFFKGTFKIRKHLLLIPDYSVVSVGHTNILCIGGATSIDRLYRIKEEQRSHRKTYWGDAELPFFDEEKLNEINISYADIIQIVATHTCPSFAYPATKGNIEEWLKSDESLSQTIRTERTIMDKIFEKLKEGQKNITDWYYGHFHEHNLEEHFGVNFRLCDCAEMNEFIEFRNCRINNF